MIGVTNAAFNFRLKYASVLSILMSQYKDFIHDFPARCHEVLRFSDERAASRGREVTLSLMAASSAFVVPLERLDTRHFLKDASRYSHVAEELSKKLSKPFLSSIFFEQRQHSWSYELIGTEIVQSEIDSWETLKNPKLMDENKDTRSVLKNIRNALSHGNIHTLGQRDIEKIVFISEKIDGERNLKGYNCLSVSPSDFRRFLLNWFEFLREQNIPQNTAFRALVEAD